MKRFAVIAALSLAPALAWPVDTTPTNLPVTIVVTAPARATLADSDIPVTILLKNISDAPLHVGQAQGEAAALADFHLTVTRIEDDGTMVPVQQTAAAPEKADLTGGGRAVLAPGETLKEIFNLRKTFAVTSDGEYLIRASRKMPYGEGKVTVKSEDAGIRIGRQM